MELEIQIEESPSGSLFKILKERGWRNGRAENRTESTPPFRRRGKKELSKK